MIASYIMLLLIAGGVEIIDCHLLRIVKDVKLDNIFLYISFM